MKTRVVWGIFLIIVLGAAVVSAGGEWSLLLLAVAAVAILFAWRFPYGAFYLAEALGLLLGLTVSVSTGDFQFGNRVFGGSIDVTLGELVAGAVVAAWALRILFLWRGRRDHNWRPYLPLIIPFAVLVGAHVLSIFSPSHPDWQQVLKYSLRPVFLSYLVSVALTVNFVRSSRRLQAILLWITLLGVFFAFDGFASLFSQGLDFGSLARAHPMLELGSWNPLGGNHNALAEILLFAAPSALALSVLLRDKRVQVGLAIGAAFMLTIALLTLARSAWISLAIMAIFLLLTLWRDYVKIHKARILSGLVLLIPLIIYMTVFSLSDDVKSSTDARALMTSLSIERLFESPLVGFGAGTYVSEVGKTYAYVVEFATPRDAHGLIQKLALETGFFGLGAFIFLFVSASKLALDFGRRLRRLRLEREAYLYLAAAAIGAFVYQLFDTTYWTPRLWLPLGLMLAAGRIWSEDKEARDPDFLTKYHA